MSPPTTPVNLYFVLFFLNMLSLPLSLSPTHTHAHTLHFIHICKWLFLLNFVACVFTKCFPCYYLHFLTISRVIFYYTWLNPTLLHHFVVLNIQGLGLLQPLFPAHKIRLCGYLKLDFTNHNSVLKCKIRICGVNDSSTCGEHAVTKCIHFLCLLILPLSIFLLRPQKWLPDLENKQAGYHITSSTHMQETKTAADRDSWEAFRLPYTRISHIYVKE